MKKLLLLSIFLSFNSFGEIKFINCNDVPNFTGKYFAGHIELDYHSMTASLVNWGHTRHEYDGGTITNLPFNHVDNKIVISVNSPEDKMILTQVSKNRFTYTYWDKTYKVQCKTMNVPIPR